MKFDNNIKSEIHKKHLAKYKGELKLPTTPLVFTEHCSNKLIKLMTDGDKILKDVKKAVEEGRPLDRFGAYLKTFQRDIHVKKGLVFNDNKLINPAALRSPFMTLLHETHPRQFWMKALAEKICWPHLYRENYYHGKNCILCIKAGRTSKLFWARIIRRKYRFYQHKMKKLTWTLQARWRKIGGNSKYLLLCLDRFTKFRRLK